MRLPRSLAAAVFGVASALCVPVCRPAAAVEIKEITTPLGIKVWLVEDKSIPVLTVSFSFAGGAASEPESQKGVSNFAAILLTDGAGPLAAQAFKQRLEDAEVSLGFGASLDRLTGSLRMLSASRAEGFELLRLALTAPRFDPDMIEQRRAQILSGLSQAEQRPAAVAQRTLMRTLFTGHPYAESFQGIPEDIKRLTADQIRARSASLLSRTGLIVSAVGDIDQAELAAELDRVFGALPAGPPQPQPPDWQAPARARTAVVGRDVPQSSVQMALPGIARDDPDWYAIFVMNHILGGSGSQSRLFRAVREARGLAYSVSSGLRNYSKAALLVISTASANEKVAETLRVIGSEMARLRDKGVTEQELADAKTYLTGSLPVSLDSSNSIAGLLYGLQIDRQTPDYLDKRSSLIAAVTPQDILRVARRLLRDDVLTTIIVGQPAGVASDP
jgi:zinc protease